MSALAPSRSWPDRITVREVGPRDGLQPEAPVPVGERVRLVEALVAAGATDALAAGADGLTVTVSVSPTYNERNVGMAIGRSVEEIGQITGLAAPGGIPVDAVVSCAFGSPYEGEVPPADVAALGARLRDAGCQRLTLADTTGMATPPRVAAVLTEVGVDVGLHLHDTRGTALVNAYEAMALGVTRFDTAVGGLGGSPFAAGAGGNLATEDLVHLCDDLGVATGLDLGLLLEASRLVADLVGRPVPSRVAQAGPRLAVAPR